MRPDYMGVDCLPPIFHFISPSWINLSQKKTKNTKPSPCSPPPQNNPPTANSSTNFSTASAGIYVLSP